MTDDTHVLFCPQNYAFVMDGRTEDWTKMELIEGGNQSQDIANFTRPYKGDWKVSDMLAN